MSKITTKKLKEEFKKKKIRELQEKFNEMPITQHIENICSLDSIGMDEILEMAKTIGVWTALEASDDTIKRQKEYNEKFLKKIRKYRAEVMCDLGRIYTFAREKTRQLEQLKEDLKDGPAPAFFEKGPAIRETIHLPETGKCDSFAPYIPTVYMYEFSDRVVIVEAAGKVDAAMKVLAGVPPADHAKLYAELKTVAPKVYNGLPKFEFLRNKK